MRIVQGKNKIRGRCRVGNQLGGTQASGRQNRLTFACQVHIYWGGVKKKKKKEKYLKIKIKNKNKNKNKNKK